MPRSLHLPGKVARTILRGKAQRGGAPLQMNRAQRGSGQDIGRPPRPGPIEAHLGRRRIVDVARNRDVEIGKIPGQRIGQTIVGRRGKRRGQVQSGERGFQLPTRQK